MKHILIIIGLLGAFYYFSSRSGRIDTSLIADLSRDDVTLYATSWCGYCKKTREFFEDNDIPYREYDIEKSKEGLQQYNEIARGSGVPVVIIKGTIIKGFSEKRMRLALNENELTFDKAIEHFFK